jgi:DNA-binding XRE family transcriptional regulator
MNWGYGAGVSFQFSLRRRRRPTKYRNRIRDCRIRRGWNQQELADELGVPRSTIGFWERGEVLPSVLVCIVLADTLGVTVPELYEACPHQRPRARGRSPRQRK